MCDRVICIRQFFSEHNDSANHQDVEDQIGRNDVFEQLRVDISKSDRAGFRICHYRARQGEKCSPHSLRGKRDRRRMMFICLRCAAKKQRVTRHRIIHTGAGQNKTVVTTESGNHDRDGHRNRARSAKHGPHRGDRDAILRCVLNFGKRERREVSDVSQDVERNDDRATDEQRSRQIFSRIADLASGKGDVIPGRLREKRPRHRFT